MERRMLIWETEPRYNEIQRGILTWAQRKMGFLLDSALVKQETSTNSQARNLHAALWPGVRFGDLQIKFPQQKVGASHPRKSKDRLTHYAEFAYTEHYPNLPEQITPLRPAIIVRNLPPYTEQTTIDLPKPGEFIIDQVPSPAREALEMSAGFAAMHYLAAYHAEHGNLAYFYEGISFASPLKDVAAYVGTALNIPPKIAGESLDSDAQVSFGITDLTAFLTMADSDPLLQKRRSELTTLKSTAEYLIAHPMDFIYVRAMVTPQVANHQIHFRNATPAEHVALFLQRSSTVIVDLHK